MPTSPLVGVSRMIELVSIVYRIHYRLDKGKSYNCKSKTGNRCSVENNSVQWVDGTSDIRMGKELSPIKGLKHVE